MIPRITRSVILSNLTAMPERGRRSGGVQAQAVWRVPGAPSHGNINNTAYRQGFCRYVVAFPAQEAVGGAMESITSRTNPLITRIRKLTGDRKYRRREGVMVCEGPKMLAEALRWGAGLETLLWQTGTHPPAGIPQGVRQVEVPGDLLRSVAPTETPQQVLFLARLPARPCRRS